MSERFAMADLTGGEMNALVKIVGGTEKVRRILKGELKLVVTDPTATKDVTTSKILAGLLELVGGPIELPKLEGGGIFVGHKYFNVGHNGELSIIYLSDNFRNNFMDVQEAIVPLTVRQRKLLKASIDRPILAALGDKNLKAIEKAKIDLQHVYQFLMTADCSRRYIFYVADAKGTVWAVFVHWQGHGLHVLARAVSDPNGWNSGHYVVSR